ncbi:unnamed protein product [Echinostoma caproni]|uniref:ABC transmembrane type-1 domain-containing protein n=1 Tax=Echinostoma caproni TaxID=27848 RepID=A0A183A7I8_9TREM|nr:unnamed protein product [Echinostoma caproni]
MRPAGRQSEMPGTTRVFACQSSESKQPMQSSTHSKRSDLDTLLELGAFHYPLDLNTADVTNHGTNTIRALADMFTCRLSNFPVTVGIFTAQNDKEYLSRLASELRNISRLSGPLALRFSVLLFLFPLVVSTFLGYVVGMLTTWQVGLSIGHIGMFLQITFLGELNRSGIEAGQHLITVSEVVPTSIKYALKEVHTDGRRKAII